MKKKAIVITVLLAGILMLTIITASVVPLNSQSLAAKYVEKLGWQIDRNPIETVEVHIPAQFDNVYKNYNAIQKEAGFNLENYKGKDVTRYTFSIKNYYGEQGVRADVLMYNDKVIGGDIMTVAINGFMVPLKSR